MDDTDECLAKVKASVLSDPAVIARRKRMEIRRFKKLASSTQLLHHDPLSFENSAFCLKRARIGQTIIELNDYPDDNLKNTTVPLSLHMEEDLFLPLLKGKEAIKLDFISPPGSSPLNDIGLFRYKSLPPRNIHINKAPCCSPDADFDKGPIVGRKDQSGRLSSGTLERGLSSSEAACSISPQITPPSMVDVPEQLDFENPFLIAEHGISPSRVLLENATAHSGPIVGTSDAEMLDLASQSSEQGGVVLSASQSIDSSSQAVSDGHFPRSGKLLVCGRRREMEDTATIVPSFTQIRRDTSGSCLCNEKVEERPLCDLHFFAVYDGHGGSQASRFCMEKLHHALAEELSSMSYVEEGNGGSSLSSMWEKAMASCFSKVDREVGGVCPNGQCDDVDSAVNCCRDSIAPENVGTTAVVAVVSSCQIVVANCGDSRAVLSRGGKAIPLSRDHKPDRDDEYNRIEAAGGRVIYWDGHRVGGLLALSRAIGDRYLKRYVVSEPEVTCLHRTEEDECLILASDGLWDVINNDTVCEIARKCLDSSRRKHASGTFALGEDPACAATAALLVKLAYGRGSKDNISVVVIDLKS